MKKLIISLAVSILALIAIVQCSSAAPAPAPEQYYKAGLSFDLFGSVRTPDLQKERLGVGVGLNYFYDQNFGIGAEIIQENFNHSTIDEVNVLLRYRIPITGTHTSLGILAGGGRDLLVGEYNIQFGGEIVHMLSSKVGIVGGARLVKTIDHDPAALGTLGLRLSW